MRRRALFTQVLVVNAVLAALIAVASALVFDLELRSVANLLAVAAVAASVGAVVNLAFLSGRFGPLEALIDAMEKVDLASAGANIDESLAREGDAEEVERLELAFLRMMRRLEAERRRASNAALQAQERERTRVARDLHDEVNQSLTGLLLRLEAVRESAPPELVAQVDETKSLANQAMRELLTLARQLRPSALDDHGLAAAVRGLAEQVEHSGTEAVVEIASTLDGAGLEDLPDEAQLVVYRVAQEAIANAIRHSGASRITLRLGPRPVREERRVGEVGARAGAELEVIDNGRGFAFAEAEHGLGLSGMRERALLAEGKLDINSRPGHGTTVRLVL